jgi:hypothetical protein
MISALTAIYHARIDYPGFNPPQLTGPLPPLPAGDLDSEERGISYNRPSDVPISRGGEVEDRSMYLARSATVKSKFALKLVSEFLRKSSRGFLGELEFQQR